MNIQSNGSRVTINGQVFTGRNLSISNGQVMIDGKSVPADALMPENGILKVQIEGDVSVVDSDVSVHINGNVGGKVKAGHSVTCQTVHGDVEAGHSVAVNHVMGNVRAGHSVHPMHQRH